MRSLRSNKAAKALVAILPVLALSLIAGAANAQGTVTPVTFDPSTVPQPDVQGMVAPFITRFWAVALLIVPLCLVGILAPKSAIAWFTTTAGSMARRR